MAALKTQVFPSENARVETCSFEETNANRRAFSTISIIDGHCEAIIFLTQSPEHRKLALDLRDRLDQFLGVITQPATAKAA